MNRLKLKDIILDLKHTWVWRVDNREYYVMLNNDQHGSDSIACFSDDQDRFSGSEAKDTAIAYCKYTENRLGV
jgi:hypothetical protein